MSEREQRERDLVLDQTQYALVLDKTKGNIIPYVGPTKASLAGTDQPVNFDNKSDKFEPCCLGDSIQNFPKADEGSYIVLENPAEDSSHPSQGVGSVPKLSFGRKINIPGPTTFPLYPGQVATVIKGHQLRSNQYLVVRVYNEKEAVENWSKAIIKPAIKAEEEAKTEKGKNLTLGQLLIIKGTEASFFIPHTGLEVIPDSNGNYVREAVTLERLEYAVLLNESGGKRWPKGPDVVFPEPTEVFIEKNGTRKFKAIELNENSGIYIKIISEYKDGDKKYKAGDEIFITGKEQSIYFPRPEHAIIKYGNQEVHYAVAITEGEGRYVLDRVTGKVNLEEGPKMLLVDPRKGVIVRRILDAKTVNLWYPGNTEALEVNREMQQKAFQCNYLDSDLLNNTPKGRYLAAFASSSNEIERKTQYTPPRTVTLDTKYKGAPKINVWTGYAVMIVDAAGNRKVINGPKKILLKYDETLEKMSLSTGKPKTTDNLYETVYLKVLHNKVSDSVRVETKDLCNISLKLSYRVNFTGDEKKWFNVENYVKLLCDHLRSILKCAAKKLSVEDLYSNVADFVRDTILGKSDQGKERAGKLFLENGMKVYDVEVLGVKIEDDNIEEILSENQRKIVEKSLELAEKERDKDFVVKSEKIAQDIETAKAQTEKFKSTLTIQVIGEKLKELLASVDKDYRVSSAKELSQNNIDGLILEREHKRFESRLTERQKTLEQECERIKCEVQAYVEKAKSINPQLVSALQSFSDKLALHAACESVSPLAILGGKSVAEVIGNIFAKTPLADTFSDIIKNSRSKSRENK